MAKTLPNHLGIILDGNRRWAKERGKTSSLGHLQGYKNFYQLSRYLFLEKKVPFLSAYVFSTENWNRAQKEVGYLMGLVQRALTEYLEDFHKDNIRITILGQRQKLNRSVLKAIDKAESQTAGNTGGTLALCFNYGGQAEIVDATKKFIEDGTKTEDVTIESFAHNLYHSEVPPVDLVVRTSGEQRLSGFMLWRASYAEFIFLDKHWPDFDTNDIDQVLEEYAQRQRRFGK